MPSADDSARAALWFAALSAVVLFVFRRPSPNFSWAELTVTGTGLPNDPNLEQRINLMLLAREILQPLRDEFGPLLITSAFRAGPVNAAVGGTGGNCVRRPGGPKCSRHTTGSAADLYAESNATNRKMAKWLWENQDRLPLAEVVIEPTGHLHLARRHQGDPPALFWTTPDMKTYTAWAPTST
jgi:zinc D-Ala-D-Ala carboxypeptidase